MDARVLVTLSFRFLDNVGDNYGIQISSLEAIAGVYAFAIERHGLDFTTNTLQIAFSSTLGRHLSRYLVDNLLIKEFQQACVFAL